MKNLELKESTIQLYNDIDKCISDLVKSRLDNNKETEFKASVEMERLMVCTLQQLSCIIDKLSEETVKKEKSVQSLITNDIQELTNNSNDIITICLTCNNKKKYKILKSDGTIILLDEWDDVYSFENGFAKVYKDGLGWNFINTEGKRINDEWYVYVEVFSEGFAVVYKEGLGQNFINTEGKYLTDEWHEWVWNFDNGLAKVKKKGLGYNFIKPDGTYLTNDWYDWVDEFYNGFAQVRLNEKYNFINKDCKLISDQWFDEVCGFYGGFARVKKKGLGWNFINTEGQYLTNEWYDYARNFCEGFAVVKKNGLGWNFINTEGQYLTDEWYNCAWEFYKGFAVVNNTDEDWCNGVYYYLGTDGQLYDKNKKLIKLK